MGDIHKFPGGSKTIMGSTKDENIWRIHCPSCGLRGWEPLAKGDEEDVWDYMIGMECLNCGFYVDFEEIEDIEASDDT